MLKYATECLIKVLSQERAGEAVLKVIASKLSVAMTEWVAATKDPLAKAALAEVQDMVKVVRMLCQDEDPKQRCAGCSHDCMQGVQAIATCSYLIQQLLGSHSEENAAMCAWV